MLSHKESSDLLFIIHTRQWLINQYLSNWQLFNCSNKSLTDLRKFHITLLYTKITEPYAKTELITTMNIIKLLLM